MAEVDDASIKDEALLLRRVPPAQWVYDENRPVNGTFRADRDADQLSMTLYETQQDVDNILRPHPTFGLVALRAKDLRAAELTITRTPENGDPNHCDVNGKPSTAKRKKLALEAIVVRAPDRV